MQSALLEKLVGVPHVIQLVALGMCTYLGDDWQALLVWPVVKLLTHADSLELVGQVGEGRLSKFCSLYSTCSNACKSFMEVDLLAMTLLALLPCPPFHFAGCFRLLTMWPKAYMGVHSAA